jgi:hypothetical protein
MQIPGTAGSITQKPRVLFTKLQIEWVLGPAIHQISDQRLGLQTAGESAGARDANT